ncbi:MAG: hypothetical protein AAF387_22255, partial [Pseudomonadota bacterium]
VAFDAETLDETLDALTIEFFSKEKHLRLNREKQQVWVSEILKFYTKDFVASGKANDLIGYINQYRDEKIPADWQVKFIDYDWTINQQP